ncbi:RimJ/RimL family protein N-acetyltransferase [Tumebacillus sp. BK434]|uniref:GNAT family N-acetyltransferase n=1 Tax=Tumebacillus sp. BK434 TaxID=2512169 RepID=UPI0010520692|nr:GNAT family N-acetyltransferase [Tumebacillus sp. BK434]TCP53912.1 RimJ/RimL family protein N-acetyltransferase [Tumebacillus sp. BK434]
MSNRTNALPVRIELWTESDLDLLRQVNAPEMTEHLGGAETDQKLQTRHRHYLAINEAGTGRMFRVISNVDQTAVGTVGYWERVWNEEDAYEMGWAVLPPYQGKGVGSAAARAAIAQARSEQKRKYMYAFPSVDNLASNAICQQLGFTWMGEREFEYPKGNFMRCNEWRFDLLTETECPAHD